MGSRDRIFHGRKIVWPSGLCQHNDKYSIHKLIAYNGLFSRKMSIILIYFFI